MDDDFCKKTACPYCSGSVYFVRHNGGTVWFDELGWPWTIHPCFVEDGVKIQYAFEEFDLDGLSDVKLGLVTNVEERVREEHYFVTVRTSNGGSVFLRVKGLEENKPGFGKICYLDLNRNRIGFEDGKYECEAGSVCRGCHKFISHKQMKNHRSNCRGLKRCEVCSEFVHISDYRVHRDLHDDPTGFAYRNAKPRLRR